MKKIIPLLILISLVGCATGPKTNVVMTFPTAPQDLTTTCPDLATVDPNTEKLSDVLNVVTANYSQYYECKVKVDAWIEWYNTQKSINDTVTK